MLFKIIFHFFLTAGFLQQGNLLLNTNQLHHPPPSCVIFVFRYASRLMRENHLILHRLSIILPAQKQPAQVVFSKQKRLEQPNAGKEKDILIYNVFEAL